VTRPGLTGWPAWHLLAIAAPAVIGAVVRVVLLRWADLLEAGDNALDCWPEDDA
jgi:hypothetical protein